MSPIKTSTASDSFGEIATLRIELAHTNPLIWREVEAPTSITLKVLHDIIQQTIGWFDYHLWELTIGAQKYGLPMDEDWGTEPRKEAIKVRLRDVIKAPQDRHRLCLRLRRRLGASDHRHRRPPRRSRHRLSALHRRPGRRTAGRPRRRPRL